MFIIGKITILEETTKNPITLIGKRAGVCWGADITDEQKNYQRGIDCIQSGHGRTLEYVELHMILDGYSARVMREYYTHIGGAPSRLQASTRYIDYSNFECVVPNSALIDQARLKTYELCVKDIQQHMETLQRLGMPREDIALLLPLGYRTKVVDKRNLRNVVDMSHQRECSRANWEFRALFSDMKNELTKYSDQWKWIVDHLFMPKCQYLQRCDEKHGCGLFERLHSKGVVG